MNLERVEVIGAGGAFDTDQINSSFLINESFLYDCGYNVFTELKHREQSDAGFIKRINTVMISHMDDDHMGSLKSLLYYRFFVYGLTTTVICNNDVKEYLHSINSQTVGSRTVSAEVVKFEDTQFAARGYISESFRGANSQLIATNYEANHHIKTSGVVIVDPYRALVAISGDSKASSAFEELVIGYADKYSVPKDNMLVFHDYSYWDAPSRQVHACRGDFEIEFTPQFQDRILKYHNNQCDLEGDVYHFNKKGEILLQEKV